MASSSRSGGRGGLYLTAPEERALTKDEDSVDGSLIGEDERLYIHHRNPTVPPEVIYLSKPKQDDRRVSNPIEVLKHLHLSDPVSLIGQSRGLICLFDNSSYNFYVCDVGEDRVVAQIEEEAVVDRPPEFLGQATYGFGHTSLGAFKIVRYPFLRPDRIPVGNIPTHLEIYHSDTQAWSLAVYAAFQHCDPIAETAFRSPNHCLLLWKVDYNSGDECRILAMNLDDETIWFIIDSHSFVDLRTAHPDSLRGMHFGLGCDGDIICSLVNTHAKITEVRVFLVQQNAADKRRWSICNFSQFRISVPENPLVELNQHEYSLLPLVGLRINENLKSLFFLLEEEMIICLNFRYNGIVWEAERRFNMDGPSPRFTAISLGRRQIPMVKEKEESGPSSSGSDSLDDHDSSEAPSPVPHPFSSSSGTLNEGSSSLLLMAEEETVLIRDPDSLQPQQDGHLLEEKIFLFFEDLKVPAMVLYLSKPKGEERLIESCVEELTDLNPAKLRPLTINPRKPIHLIGHSLGLVCFRDSCCKDFYVLNVATKVFEEVIPEDVGDPGLGFSRDATYGFGHTDKGTFRIVRFPFWASWESTPTSNTYFDVYRSETHRWARVGFRGVPIWNPLADAAFLFPEQSSLFWKVEFDGHSAILAYHLNDDSISDVIDKYDVQDISGQGYDVIRRMTFGPGFHGQILACILTMGFDVGHVKLFDAHVKLYDLHLRDDSWSLVDHSSFDLSLPSNTLRFQPLAGLCDDAQQQRFLFFLRNQDDIIGIKYQFDGSIWKPITNFNLRLIGIRGSQPPRYSAISMGPRIIKMPKDEGSDDSNTTKNVSADNSKASGPVPPQPFSSKAQTDEIGNPLERSSAKKLSSKSLSPRRSIESDDSSNSKSHSHDGFNASSPEQLQPFSSDSLADVKGNPIEDTCAENLTKDGKGKRTKERDK